MLLYTCLLPVLFCIFSIHRFKIQPDPILITTDLIAVLLKCVLIWARPNSESNLKAFGQFEVTSRHVVNPKTDCNNVKKKLISNEYEDKPINTRKVHINIFLLKVYRYFE